MQIPKELKSKIRSALRKIWMWYSEPRKQKISHARISRGRYKCESCNNVVAKIEIDHINPCGSFTTWNEMTLFCEKLFCNINNLRALCHECHKKKTKEQRKKK